MIQTIIIHLPRNKDRKNAMLQKIKKTCLTHFHFFDAIDGKNDLHKYKFKIIPHFIDPCYFTPINTGTIGCTLSHYYVWKYIIENKIQRALILEDDATFYENFDNVFKTVLELDIPYDIFYLNRIPQNEEYNLGPEIEMMPNIVIPKYSYNASTYIITYSGAKKMIESNCLEHFLPIDELLPIMYDPLYPFKEYSKYYDNCQKLVAYALKECIADQEKRDNFPSDVEYSQLYNLIFYKGNNIENILHECNIKIDKV